MTTKKEKETMHNIIDKYAEYKANEAETWRSRFTWMGLDGKNPKHTTSILRFNADTNAFTKMKPINNTEDLLKEVKKLAVEYVAWVKSKKGNEYGRLDYEDMERFFQGAIGEYFFYRLFEDVKCVLTPDNGGVITRYDFNFVSPTLRGEKDLGVDLYGIANDTPSVIQVKFWNPWTKYGISIKTIQGAYAEGISNNIIDKDSKDNMFICFLGQEAGVYDKVRTLSGYRKHVVAIGRTALGYTIDNRNKIFWDNLKASLVGMK